MLISTVQKSESALCMHRSPLFWISFPFRSPQSAEWSSLWYTVGSHKLSIFINFPIAQTVKNLPAMQETQVWSLSQEDPLEKEMVTHSSILAWRIPWAEEPDRLQFMGSQRVGLDWATNTFTRQIPQTISVHQMTVTTATNSLASEGTHVILPT